MKGPFSSFHARALCHATEVLDRVEQAVSNVVAEAQLETRRVTGHHGNEITVVEAHSTDHGDVRRLFDGLSRADRARLMDTINLRLDESCNLFLRVDKQAAYSGNIILTESEDVVAIRLKVSAYPAKRDVAAKRVEEFLRSIDEGG